MSDTGSSPNPKRRTTRWPWFVLILASAVALAVIAGPRVDVSDHPRPLTLPATTAGLDAYLAAAEAAVGDVVPGAEKHITWAHGDHRRTPVAVVYLHGFSASRQETAPLSENVARALGANLFDTRFTGHGRTSPGALGEATVADWLNDAREALAIGRLLGERVLIIATSNGGALATWLAAQPEGRDLNALVLIAPNFGTRNKGTEKLLLPWGETLLNRTVPAEIVGKARSDAHATYWTLRYPRHALMTMIGAVKLAREAPLESITTPTLLIHAADDPVVDTELAATHVARFGGRNNQRIVFAPQPDTDHHVIAGRIRSPANTDEVATHILAFVRPILGKTSVSDHVD